jgi:hypothetical protein
VERLPFSVYDFFGYLAAGALLLAALDLGFFDAAHVADDPSLTGGILAILAAYIAGQLVASLASTLLESGLVGRVLGRPARTLTEPAAGWRARLFAGYVAPLTGETRQRLRQRVRSQAGRDLADEDLFWHCYPVARERPTTAARLATFLNLYGFCRNIATGAAIAALVLAAATVFADPPAGIGWWIAAAALVTVGMTYRYLKFLRLYGVEVFIGYLAASDARDPSDPAPTLTGPADGRPDAADRPHHEQGQAGDG